MTISAMLVAWSPIRSSAFETKRRRMAREMVEFGITDELFIKPKKKQTEDYITGRFG